MRLALAQINSVVGDIDGNAARIVEWLERARGENADLVLFPELVVTGYPAEDLLLRPGFVRAARRAVDGIAKATHGITALVGAPHLDTDLFNACFVLAHGEVCCIYRKRYLPNYGVFDEDRYFAPGNDLFLLRFGDVRVGPTICEDIWQPGPPATDLALGGAQLIANISASPFHVGKDREREEMLKVRALDNACFVALCNAVGGQDELIFDGHSVVLDDEGTVLARERPAAHVAQAPSDRSDRVDVDHEQLLLEPGRAGDDVTFDVENDRVTVEDQLVLAADRVAERDEAQVVGRPYLQHLFALTVLADVERRGRDVRNQLCAREREVGRRWPGLPHVLADRGADHDVAEAEQHEVVARREIPVFVEDAVVRQVALAVDVPHLAVGKREACVVEVGVEVGSTDERRDPVGRLRDLVDRAPRRADEAGPQEQVLRRIAGDDELREEDEVGAGVPGLVEPLDDACRVAVDIADDAIDLCECDPHR
jgi:predicted amidohydrolase